MSTTQGIARGLRGAVRVAVLLLALAAAMASALEGAAGEAVDAARLSFYRDGNARAALAILDTARQGVQILSDKLGRRLALADIALAAGEISEAAGNRTGAEPQFAAALAQAQAAVDGGARSSEAYRILADASMRILPYRSMLYKMRHGTEAKGHLDKALALDPKNRDAILSLGQFYLFCPPAFGGSKPKAVDEFRRFSSQASDDLTRFQGFIWQGIALRKAGRDVEAEGAFQKAAQVLPRSPWLAQERARK